MKKALLRTATVALAAGAILGPTASAFAVGVDETTPPVGGCKKHVVVDYTYGNPNPLTLSVGADCN
jgi:hypothetical protein